MGGRLFASGLRTLQTLQGAAEVSCAVGLCSYTICQRCLDRACARTWNGPLTKPFARRTIDETCGFSSVEDDTSALEAVQGLREGASKELDKRCDAKV
eukprot:1298704-Amphidinium_carterae.1